MNRWDGVGNLTRTPVLDETPDGTLRTTFRVAIDREHKSADGQRKTDFISCVAWGSLATLITTYGRKGRLVSVGGELQSRTVAAGEDRRTAYEIRVESFQFLDARPRDTERPTA